MIYFIGGVSKVGKSYLSKKIMEENKIPYFSTDFLLWSLGGTNGNGICDYFDNDSITTPILRPYILKIISFLYKSNANYVIEGTHIDKDLIYEVERLYPGFSKSVFLGYKDSKLENKISEIKLFENESDNLWYKELNDNEFNKFIEEEINDSLNIYEMCKNNNLNYFEVKDIKSDYKEIKKILGL